MASAEFDDASEEKRPTVQVGDPFTEKLLLEACLELMAEDAIVAIQDMGAAGLTSSSVEMADKGGVGIELELDRVPTREEGMTAYEMMLSESQERMLMILKPGSEKIAERVFRKWELDFSVIGYTTDTGRLVVRHRGMVEADIPLAALAHAAPVYERPWTKTEPQATVAPEAVPAPNSQLGALECLMGSPALASRRWIWEQYDHMVMADTVQRPGGDAARGARARHQEGARHLLRRDAPLLRRRSASRARSRRSPNAGATSPRSAPIPSPSPTA